MRATAVVRESDEREPPILRDPPRPAGRPIADGGHLIVSLDGPRIVASLNAYSYVDTWFETEFGYQITQFVLNIPEFKGASDFS